MTLLSRNDIEIRITILNADNLIARATVIFFGCVETHGWRIMKSTIMHPVFQENIWIQPPCFRAPKTKSGWKEIVYINHKNTFEFIQSMIYDAYHMARSKKEGLEATENKESSKEKMDLEVKSEDIKTDDIPY